MSGAQQITHEDAAAALDSLDDLARMDAGVDPVGPRGVLERYIQQQAAAQAVPIRAQLWANAWCACAAASNCLASEVANRWADGFLKAFDKRFGQASVTGGAA